MRWIRTRYSPHRAIRHATIWWGLICFLSLALVGCGHPASSGDDWKKPSGPKAAFVTSLAQLHPDNPRRLYAGTLNGGVLYSEDGGANWHPLVPDQQPWSKLTGLGEHEQALDVQSIATSPSGQAFAATLGQGVYAQMPGEPWIHLKKNLRSKAFSVTEVTLGGEDQTLVYAGTQEGVWLLSGPVEKSTEWRRIDPWAGIESEHIQTLFASRDSTPRLYVGTKSGFFRSLNNGEEWERATEGIDRQVLVVAMAVNPDNSDHLVLSDWERQIYHSTDGGVTWQASDQVFESVIEDLAFSKPKSEEIYAITYSGLLYVSHDEGRSWQLDSEIDAPALSLLETTEKRLLVGTDGFGIRIRELGHEWQSAQVSAPLLSVSSLLPRGEELYAGTECCGVFRRTIGGKWLNFNEGLPLHGRVITAFAADSRSIYVGTTGAGVYARAWKETEWQPMQVGLPPDAWQIHSLVSLSDASEPLLLVGTSNGLFRLEGDRWVRKAPILIQETVSNLIWEPETKIAFATATGGQLYMSDDGGKNWSEEDQPEGSIERMVLATGNPFEVMIYGGAAWTVFAQIDDTIYHRHSDDPIWKEAGVGDSENESIAIFSYPFHPSAFLAVRTVKGDNYVLPSDIAPMAPPSRIALRFQEAKLETDSSAEFAGALTVVADPRDHQMLYVGMANGGVRSIQIDMPGLSALIPDESPIKRIALAVGVGFGVLFLILVGYVTLLLFVIKPPEPVELAIQITARQSGQYQVKLMGPGDTSVKGDVSLEESLAQFQQTCLDAFLGKSGQNGIHTAGAKLFSLVFGTKSLYGFYSGLKKEAKRSFLRLRLDVDEELARLPWEMLFDPDADELLSLTSGYSVVRDARSDEPLSEWKPGNRVNVLMASACPKNYPPLAIEEEMVVLDELQRASRAVKVRFEEHTTTDVLLARVQEDFQLLHYVGHAEEGSLILDAPDQQEDPLSGYVLASALGKTEMRMLFLNTCDTISSPQVGDAALAQGLASRGVPLVLAMQRKIPDQDALVLVRAFYDELVATGSVELALCKARRAIRDQQGSLSPPNWAIPVLLMRGPSTDLLRPRHWLRRRLSLRHASRID